MRRRCSSPGKRTNEQRTLQLIADEMAVELRLADQELELTRLARSLAFLLLEPGAVERLLLLAPAHVALLLFVLLPEHEHLAHQPLALRLHVLGRLGRARVRLAGLERGQHRDALHVRQVLLVAGKVVFVHLCAARLASDPPRPRPPGHTHL
jgi:hypothetical protein